MFPSEYATRVKLQTFGLREDFLGQRFVFSRGGSSGEIIDAVENAWMEEIRNGNFQVHLIRPQPPETPRDCIALLVEIWTPQIDIDFLASVVIDTFLYLPRSTDADVHGTQK